jgi:hypothetical protein
VWRIYCLLIRYRPIRPAIIQRNVAHRKRDPICLKLDALKKQAQPSS